MVQSKKRKLKFVIQPALQVLYSMIINLTPDLFSPFFPPFSCYMIDQTLEIYRAGFTPHLYLFLILSTCEIYLFSLNLCCFDCLCNNALYFIAV